MVSASQKRKSLFDFPGSAGATGFGRMGTYTAASTCARTSAVTGGYNQELNSFLCDMRATQAADAARYGDKLFTPNSAARQRGVELAWRYEKKSILMGGKGSENWTAAERREIVETGSLRGSQGHHQRNVALHPEDQANPHNIKFYRSQREHLQNGHKGSWSNESDAPMINRDKMLTRTNARRVFRNEVRGIGLTAAIGLGIGFSIGFAATLAQSGISVGTIQDALKGGLQGGLTAARPLCHRIRALTHAWPSRLLCRGRRPGECRCGSYHAVGTGGFRRRHGWPGQLPCLPCISSPL